MHGDIGRTVSRFTCIGLTAAQEVGPSRRFLLLVGCHLRSTRCLRAAYMFSCIVALDIVILNSHGLIGSRRYNQLVIERLIRIVPSRKLFPILQVRAV